MKQLGIYTFFAISVLLLSSLSCQETINPVSEEDHGGLIEGEIISQKISHKYSGTDLNFNFSNGANFSLKATDNVNSPKEKVTISLISDERFFNTESDIVFDFSDTKSTFNLDFEYLLPKSLAKENIAILIYSPSSSDFEFDSYLVDFIYNEESGMLSTKITVPTEYAVTSSVQKQKNTIMSQKSNYSRLAISWSLREKLSDSNIQKIIKMPFYEQNYNTCWAACAKIMCRAYSVVNNSEQKIRLNDIIKGMNHRDYNQGIGVLNFRSALPKLMKNMTDIKFQTSSFMFALKLKEEIIKKIDNNMPMILNFRFPGVGSHQLLILGYEIRLLGAGKTSLYLLYHNPNNVGEESMYKWAEFEWLMQDKWSGDFYQILYADQPLPSNTPLQTIATPMYNMPSTLGGQALGDLSFIVKRKTEHAVFDIPINMVYDYDKTEGYSWIMRSVNPIEISVIPDSTIGIKLKQPIFNADNIDVERTISISAYNYGSGYNPYNEKKKITLKPGTSYFDEFIELGDFFDSKEDRKYFVEVHLLGNNQEFLDGYTFDFTLAAKEIVKFDFSLWLVIDYVCYNEDGDTYTNERVENVAVELKGNKRTFSGRLYEIKDYGEITKTIELIVDNIDDPKEIVYLKYHHIQNSSSFDYKLITQFSVVFENIKILESEKNILFTNIERNGDKVCENITSMNYSRETEDTFGNCSEFRCNSNSELDIEMWW